MKKGQGAFEYILMVGGVLFFMTVVFFYMRSSLTGTGADQIDNAFCRNQLANSQMCWNSEGVWVQTKCKVGDACIWSQTRIDKKCYDGDQSSLANSPWDNSGGLPIGDNSEFICTNQPPA